MRAAFYIHIGIPKTGTSSIQQTFFNNREKLLRHDINYLSARRNHGGILTSLLHDKPQDLRSNIVQGYDTPEKANSHNDVLRRRLTAALSSNRSAKFVISGEALSALPANKIHQLKGMFDPFANSYRIIVYVRDPYEYANSATIQSLRHGAPLTGAAKNVPRPDYRRSISKYIQIFGRENVDIRIFDPRHFVGGDLIVDFLAALGESSDLKDIIEVANKNKSLPHEAAMILSETNIAVPILLDNGLRNPERAYAFVSLMEEIEGEKFSIDESAYLEHEVKGLTDLEWLHQTVGESVFAKGMPRPASTPVWSDATIRSIRKLVATLAQRIEKLKAETPSISPDIAVPADLKWLEDAVRSASPDREETQPIIVPSFDQTIIRSLGCFINGMALTAQQLTREDAERRSRTILARIKSWIGL